MSARALVFCFALLLAPPAAAGPGAPGWRSGWGLTSPLPRAPVADPATIAPARLRLHTDGGQWRAQVDNRLHGPVQIDLQAADGRRMAGLPLRTVLAVQATVALNGLPAPTPQQRLDLQLRAVPGDPAARVQDVPYALPFTAAPVRISQGPGGGSSHHDAGNQHALDFALAEGTPVLAARPGVVMEVRDGFGAGTDAPGQDREQVNLVRVLHADGSMAVYAHLLAGAMAVHPGQQVATGQPLGRSGNSGFSSGPHLHFVVQVNAGMQLRSVPVRILTPAGLLRPAREPRPTPARPSPAPAAPG